MESVIREDGAAHPTLDPELTLEQLRTLFADMVRVRAIDERLGALADEGEIGFFPSARGREAAVIGTAASLEPTDWIFGTHADWPAAVHRKVPLARLAHRVFASADDPLLGHDAPTGFSDRRRAIASVSAPSATHLPHAVGVAYAARQNKHNLVTAALFDAREIDAADFHTGLNFAGVMKTATLFVCLRGDGEGSAAEHAEAYGIPSVACDGSDLLAVCAIVRDAYRHAAAGHGPTVIDLSLEGPEEAMERARQHLVNVGGFTEAEELALSELVRTELDEAIAAAREASALDPRTLFDGVYRRPTPHLRAQADALAGLETVRNS